MIPQSIRKTALLLTALVLLTSQAFSETRYDRDLVVKDETRAMKVEQVFKELIAAYEDEDPQGFLDLVSDERFRQDYITFTDALYSDFRNYEIHQVEYWIDRVVSDHIKQFLFVKWEKRYETLESGRQNTLSGYSRFLFDEVNGKYLLIELAGNPLFGGSLEEWREEMPPISGQVVTVAKAEKNTMAPAAEPPTTGTMPPPAASCDNSHLFLCNSGNCASAGGYWYNGTCNTTKALPDLTIESLSITGNYPIDSTFVCKIRVKNIGLAESTPFTISIIDSNCGMGELTSLSVASLQPGQSTDETILGDYECPPVDVILSINNGNPEADTSNNKRSITVSNSGP